MKPLNKSKIALSGSAAVAILALGPFVGASSATAAPDPAVGVSSSIMVTTAAGTCYGTGQFTVVKRGNDADYTNCTAHTLGVKPGSYSVFDSSATPAITYSTTCYQIAAGGTRHFAAGASTVMSTKAYRSC